MLFPAEIPAEIAAATVPGADRVTSPAANNPATLLAASSSTTMLDPATVSRTLLGTISLPGRQPVYGNRPVAATVTGPAGVVSSTSLSLPPTSPSRVTAAEATHSMLATDSASPRRPVVHSSSCPG